MRYERSSSLLQSGFGSVLMSPRPRACPESLGARAAPALDRVREDGRIGDVLHAGRPSDLEPAALASSDELNALTA